MGVVDEVTGLAKTAVALARSLVGTADIGVSATGCAPAPPTTLGSESAMPSMPRMPPSTVDTGSTACSSPSTASTMRAPVRPIA